MVMVESNAPDPLEPVFQDFEKKSGWKLSPQARTILREGVVSVGIDTLGLGDLAIADRRFAAAATVIKLMPDFLKQLKSRAETRDKIETGPKVIGGVFVLQNIGLWQGLFGCTCWPV
jgi:hypothetical protein